MTKTIAAPLTIVPSPGRPFSNAGTIRLSVTCPSTVAE